MPGQGQEAAGALGDEVARIVAGALPSLEARSEVGRIDHGADHVHVLGDGGHVLAGQDQVLHPVPGHDAVQVRRNAHAQRRQHGAGLGQEPGDDLPATQGRTVQVTGPVAPPAVGGEAHVVELDLVDTGRSQFPGQGQVVFPHGRVRRIDPHAAAFRPGLAGGSLQGQFRMPRPQFAVEEEGEAGHHVEAPAVEAGHHVPQAGKQGHRAVGAPGSQGVTAAEGHAAVDVLGVEDHRVATGGDEAVHPGEDRRDRTGRCGQVDAPDLGAVPDLVLHLHSRIHRTHGNTHPLPDAQQIGVGPVGPAHVRQHIGQGVMARAVPVDAADPDQAVPRLHHVDQRVGRVRGRAGAGSAQQRDQKDEDGFLHDSLPDLLRDGCLHVPRGSFGDGVQGSDPGLQQREFVASSRSNEVRLRIPRYTAE